MKTLLLKLLILGSIIVISIFVISVSYTTHYDKSNDYLAAIIDKHHRLEEIKVNRLILMGGSSFAFGINSELIEKEFNMNVINLALHAGLGSSFIFNEVKSSINKGDIVLLGLEYPLYDNEYKPNLSLINYTQHLYPKSRQFYKFCLKDKVTLHFENFRRFFQGSRSMCDSIYNRKKFNHYGDVTGHLNKPSKYISGNASLQKMNISDRIKMIQDLNVYCNNIGARLFIVFPCYPSTDFKHHQKIIWDIYNNVSHNLNTIPVLNTPEYFVFDDKFFFDTEYHLNSEARTVMTNKLIKILKDNVYKPDNGLILTKVKQ